MRLKQPSAALEFAPNGFKASPKQLSFSFVNLLMKTKKSIVMQKYFTKFPVAIILVTLFLVAGCSKERKTMEVTATAYNSLPEQTRPGSSGAITAWGDTLKPGMKCIAVSRDLIDSGLVHNKEVKIEGLEGTYRVNDKMNKRWTKKIDIYLGTSQKDAKEWGKKTVTISWEVDDEPAEK